MWALRELWRSGQAATPGESTLLFCLLEHREQVAFLTAELTGPTQASSVSSEILQATKGRY